MIALKPQRPAEAEHRCLCHTALLCQRGDGQILCLCRVLHKIVRHGAARFCQVALMTPEDVVLFVSYSGATRDMLETLRAAKAAGAKIILLTHYEDSPGAKLADIVLLCGAQESPLDSGNIPVKVALLYVAEVLVLRYTMDDPENANAAQDRTSEALAVKML